MTNVTITRTSTLNEIALAVRADESLRQQAIEILEARLKYASGAKAKRTEKALEALYEGETLTYERAMKAAGYTLDQPKAAKPKAQPKAEKPKAPKAASKPASKPASEKPHHASVAGLRAEIAPQLAMLTKAVTTLAEQQAKILRHLDLV